MNNGYTKKAHTIVTKILQEEFGWEYEGTPHPEVATRLLDAVARHVDFGNEPEPERHALLGFQIIHEMTADEMLEEALAFQRGQWEKASKNQLKKFVIEARAHQHKARLIKEAQLEPEGLWPFGGGVATDEQA